MLKGIPECISPELLSVMMRMGHGDELVLADGDFPADTCGKRVIRADGLRIYHLLDAVLPFFPLDSYVKKPVMIMAAVGCAKEPPEWKGFGEIISKYYTCFEGFDYIERFDFYQRSKDAFAVVITGEPDGNVILRKGVVNE